MEERSNGGFVSLSNCNDSLSFLMSNLPIPVHFSLTSSPLKTQSKINITQGCRKVWKSGVASSNAAHRQCWHHFLMCQNLGRGWGGWVCSGSAISVTEFLRDREIVLHLLSFSRSCIWMFVNQTSLCIAFYLYMTNSNTMTERNSKHVHIITESIQLTWLTNDGFIRPNAKEEKFSLLFLKPRQLYYVCCRLACEGGKGSFFSSLTI